MQERDIERNRALISMPNGLVAGMPAPFSDAALFRESDHTIPFACIMAVGFFFSGGKMRDSLASLHTSVHAIKISYRRTVSKPFC